MLKRRSTGDPLAPHWDAAIWKSEQEGTEFGTLAWQGLGGSSEATSRGDCWGESVLTKTSVGEAPTESPLPGSSAEELPEEFPLLERLKHRSLT